MKVIEGGELWQRARYAAVLSSPRQMG